MRITVPPETLVSEQRSPDRTVTLRDGRRLGYTEFGDPAGRPLLYFHGWPSSRLEASNFHQAGAQLGVRVIGIDRPGFGLSDFRPGYRVRDWPADVAEFAGALGLERYPVVAVSSGSPYALACAYAIPERLSAVGVASGVPPLDLPSRGEYVDRQELQLITVGRRAPWLGRLLLHYLEWQLRRDRQKFLASLVKDFNAVDRAVFDRYPGFGEMFLRGLEECLRQGPRGAIAAIALEGEPWGFPLGEITRRIYLWHGELDNLAYPAGARALAAQLPDCELVLYPEESHVSTVLNRAEEIVAALAPA
jgi:pimeloyl-ACP methyl ester carboxylesterase